MLSHPKSTRRSKKKKEKKKKGWQDIFAALKAYDKLKIHIIICNISDYIENTLRTSGHPSISHRCGMMTHFP